MRTRPRVLAIAIDGVSQSLFAQWLDAGLLPNLQKLRERSATFRVVSQKKFSNEHCWIPMLTGIGRDRFDHWLDRWDSQRYRYDEASIFDWLQAPVFYALGNERRVIAFDLTAPLVPGVDGLQVSGWASELNECFPGSEPPQLFDELLARHGPDPKLADATQVTNQVSQRAGVSHTLPTMYDTSRLKTYAQGQVRSVQRRVDAGLDLMGRIDWDLFITSFSETHTAGHLLWHLSQPHALDGLRHTGEDPLLQVYQAVDSALPPLLEGAGDDAHVVLFTLDSMGTDCLENARALLLPEFMYRWNFPGKAALALTPHDAPLPAARLDFSEHWKHEVWKLRTPEGDRELESPAQQQARGDAMGWCPANWYRPLWPSMRAFAMPTVADGYVRINVAGREAHGVVAPADFDAVCSELESHFSALIDPRTGEPVVSQVIRVRTSPFDDDPKAPPADLIVVFNEARAIDCIESPAVGRIGPVPFFRTGSHPAHGTVLENILFIAGPGTEAGTSQDVAQLQDIPATILHLMGMPVPPSFDGVPRG